jgi:mRNA interferase MazF
MICNRLQVVLVPFPFMERPAAKRRPALVLSNKEFNSDNDHSIMAMITTAKSSQWHSDYKLSNPTLAGLKVDCYVRWKIFTLPNSLIVRKIGELDKEDQKIMMERSRSIFTRD